VELPVARIPSGNWMTLPIHVLHGSADGPVIWISSAIHGDELNGVAIIRELLSKISPKKLSGTLLAVPIVNGFGVMEGSRFLPDGRDLNRSFPGSPRGSLAGRLANLFFTHVATKGDLGIDLHTGSGGRDNLPQIRCDLDNEITRRFARAFAAPLTLHSRLRDGSLREAARTHGIPTLLFEAGEANRFSADAIQYGVEGLQRVLFHAGMIQSAPTPKQDERLLSRKSRWIRTRQSGFCSIQVALGQRVKEGAVLARVQSPMEKRDSLVRAPFDSLVISVTRKALVYRGDAAIHLAEVVSE